MSGFASPSCRARSQKALLLTTPKVKHWFASSCCCAGPFRAIFVAARPKAHSGWFLARPALGTHALCGLDSPGRPGLHSALPMAHAVTVPKRQSLPGGLLMSSSCQAGALGSPLAELASHIPCLVSLQRALSSGARSRVGCSTLDARRAILQRRCVPPRPPGRCSVGAHAAGSDGQPPRPSGSPPAMWEFAMSPPPLESGRSAMCPGCSAGVPLYLWKRRRSGSGLRCSTAALADGDGWPMARAALRRHAQRPARVCACAAFARTAPAAGGDGVARATHILGELRLLPLGRPPRCHRTADGRHQGGRRGRWRRDRKGFTVVYGGVALLSYTFLSPALLLVL